MATYSTHKPRRRQIPTSQGKLARAIKWLCEISDRPYYVLLTDTWSQDERDNFIVKNHLTQIFLPDADLDIARGILVKEIPTFVKTGTDYDRMRPE
jgi:hypothetical protein